MEVKLPFYIEKVMNANMFGKVQVQFLLMNEILWAKTFLITSFGVFMTHKTDIN